MTMAAIATTLAVGSAVVEGISGFQAGRYRAAVAGANQKTAEENARRAIDRAQVEQQEQDVLTLATLGEQEAVQSASGLSLGSKSFMLTRKRAKNLGRLDALNVRQAGEVEAYNYRTEAMNFAAENQAARSDAAGALVGGLFKAGGSLIGGSARVRDPSRFTAAEPVTARLPRPRPRSLMR